MQVRWHGHACYSIVTSAGRSLLIDPFITDGPSRRGLDAFAPDLVLVTHAHNDHVGDALDLGAPILSTHELAIQLAQRGADATGMGIGGFTQMADTRIWCAPANHSSAWDRDETLLPGGKPCGFVIDDGTTRFYHTGDTGIFGDMRTVIRDLLQPHVAAVPIGDHYTMGVEHAARAVEWLGVDVATPMHYDTFDKIRADPKRFEALVGTHAQVVVPAVDGGFEMQSSRLIRLLEP